MRLSRLLSPALLLVAALAVAGCESSQEKAERYYQSGMQLLAQGDVDRALVEFRNVFKYNGLHKEARKAYADTVLKQGKTEEAYSQYLRLIEQYPDTPDVRRILAELAILNGSWSEAERHGREAIRLAPNAPGVPAIAAALDYHKAVQDGDDAARAKAAKAAQAVLETDPDSRVALRVVIDWLARGDDPAQALPLLDRALALDPDEPTLQTMKLQILARTGNETAVGEQLKEMTEQFPDEAGIRNARLSWYLSRGDLDGAEAFLRQLAGAPTGPVEPHATLVQFLQRARGVAAAKAELQTLVAANDGTANGDFYRAMQAGIAFDEGDRAGAISSIESVLKTAAPSDQTRRIKTMLARMLDLDGNRVGARSRIEEVLAEDPTQADALKQRAAWLIDEDRPNEAILDLRTALSQSPRDPATLTLMAQAYERSGSPDLAGEQLALAVDASGGAAEESLRYANFLLRQGRTPAADKVLTDARRVSPNNVAVLALLGQIALEGRDFTRVEDILSALAGLKAPEAVAASRSLRAALLTAQGRGDESLAFLEEQAQQSGDTGAAAALVQAYVRKGDLAAARSYLDTEKAKRPDDAGLQLLSANLHVVEGDPAAAEAEFRAILATHPGADRPAQLLYGLLLSTGRADDAAAVLKEALAASPKSVALRLLQAGALQQAGDIEGAIAVYDQLYAEDSSNVVVANNLASLITTYHDDADGLARATAIAQRLKGATQPPLQDTYGWIAYRNGNYSEAVGYLEPAAAGLPNDPLVQFHLGMTYLKLGRTEDARRQLAHTLDVAGDSPLPQFATAREELAKLGGPPTAAPEAAPATPPETTPEAAPEPAPAAAPAPQ